MKIGDHFVLRMEVPVKKELKAEPERRLKKGACWMNPGYFSTLEWKTILKERWKNHSPEDWWEGNRKSVEETWQAFMNMMDRLHREAFTYADKWMDAVLENTTSTDKERKEARMTKEVIEKERAK